MLQSAGFILCLLVTVGNARAQRGPSPPRPRVESSAVLGGATGDTNIAAVALDPSGNTYSVGYTFATDFSIDGTPAGSFAQGSSLLAATAPNGSLRYVKSLGTGSLWGVAVDAGGSVWVAGHTWVRDFPVVRPSQPAFGGGQYDAVVAKFSPAGNLVFATYLGGSDADGAKGIALDQQGNAYVTGYTVSPDFPVTPGAAHTSWRVGASFVTRFTPDGAVSYSAVFGGADWTMASAIDVDSAGAAWIAGSTADTAPGRGIDGFLARFDASGALQLFERIGGHGDDAATAIRVSPGGAPCLAGNTTSADFPVTPGAMQSGWSGLQDGWVARWDVSRSAFGYATYLGGEGRDEVNGLAVDADGRAYVTGSTRSILFPLRNRLPGTSPGVPPPVFRSVNAGRDWSPPDGLVPGSLSSLSPDPVQSSTLVASTETGVYRTTDGGATWTRQSTVGGGVLSRSPVNPALLYDAVGFRALYGSTDGGVTWTRLPDIGGGIVVPDGTEPATAYYTYTLEGYFGIYKTTDAGRTWSNLRAPTSQSFYLSFAARDGALYGTAQGRGYFKSTDHGATWQSLTLPAANSSLAAGPASILYAWSGGSIYRSVDAGESWRLAGALPFNGPATVSPSPLDPSLVYALDRTSASILVSTDSGATWTPASQGLERIQTETVIPSPASAAVAYATTSNLRPTAFLTEIDPDGSDLVLSTLIGFPGGVGNAVAVSPDAIVAAGNATPAGSHPRGFVTRLGDPPKFHGPYRRR